MARFGLGVDFFRGVAPIFWGMVLWPACRGAEPESVHAAARVQDPSLPCGEDEVREYFCDDLLPLSSSRPAPEPYDNCPATTDIRPAAFPAVDRIAAFDIAYTAYTRKRVQPGHSCCYGWCAKVTVSDPNLAAPTACHDASGLYESFCMRELEQGSSLPAAAPFEHCPLALKPPEVVAFSSPASALLDPKYTAQRRRDLALADCCYGWCSKAPTGTVLKPSHPKIK